MAEKIKVPKSAMRSTATLVCPPEFTDELPSCWYVIHSIVDNINFSVLIQI